MANVVIEEYNPQWIIQFEEEKGRLESILNDKAICIEHIGSTSVTGLGAKPILDIAVAVHAFSVVHEFFEPLRRIGYEFVDHAAFPERRFFRKGPWGAGTHHLHIYLFDEEPWKNQLIFRNFLRKHPEVLKEYYQLKLRLSQDFQFDRASYTEGKTEFIQEMLRQAKIECGKFN
ncbi:GrpB family protein [Jeotgalibacillus proteolyticus]|uniref:GrpB family protein n=1 Tax=Jeotgalibacillus proteolyticus TaxID=2082395 RepID=UPI003CF783B8